MADENLDERAFLLLASATEPVSPTALGRQRLMASVEAERYLPFCAELARWFDLAVADMRTLLARVQEPDAWLRGIPPVLGKLDFRPGPALAPLRGGFVRMQGGFDVPRHRHTDREVTFVLAGTLKDGNGRAYGPGDAIDMPQGSIHTLGVPRGEEALVAILHGRIEMLGD
jgi:hypothetical protein